MFTLESPVVSHVEVGETGGQDVGAVLVPLQVAATWGEGLDIDINRELREFQCVYLGENSLHLGNGVKAGG